MGGIGHGLQTLWLNFYGASNTEAEHAVLDAFQRGVDEPELAPRRPFQGLEDFVVFHRNGRLRRIPWQRFTFSLQVAAHARQPVAQFGGAGQQRGARGTFGVIGVSVHDGQAASPATSPAFAPALIR